MNTSEKLKKALIECKPDGIQVDMAKFREFAEDPSIEWENFTVQMLSPQLREKFNEIFRQVCKKTFE